MSSTASAARVAANKANALKPTGPRTPEGKARVSENALKHGLRSERNPLDLATATALPVERAEFQATLAAFLKEFAPASPLETRLVERLAQIDLRLNRAVRMENTHLEMNTRLVAKSMAGALPPDEQTQQAWLTTLAFLNNPSPTTLIVQYESRLARDFQRTLTQLRQAQKLRLQNQVQETCNQTQPAAMPLKHTTTDPCTTQQSHPSDGVVAAETPHLTTMPTQSPAPGSRVATNPAPWQSAQATQNNLAEQTQFAPQAHHPAHQQTNAGSV